VPGDEVKVGQNGTTSTDPGKTELLLGFDLQSESGRWIAAPPMWFG